MTLRVAFHSTTLHLVAFHSTVSLVKTLHHLKHFIGSPFLDIDNNLLYQLISTPKHLDVDIEAQGHDDKDQGQERIQDLDGLMTRGRLRKAQEALQHKVALLL